MGVADVELELPWKATLDDEAFVDLGYTTHATISSDSSQRREQPLTERPRHGAPSFPRFKRKRFSKQLQLLCLQRYAGYAKKYGRLPNKHETERLLHQSYLHFLHNGGERDESSLTYVEFLKLVRNRRSEINARVQRPQCYQKAQKQVMVLTPAKRKSHEERDKIRGFIEEIDRTREQTGLIPNPQQRTRHGCWQRTVISQQPTQPTTVLVSGSKSLAPKLLDPMEQMEAILRIQQETRKVQREIAARLRSVSCAIRQIKSRSGEPSSVSV